MRSAWGLWLSRFVCDLPASPQHTKEAKAPHTHTTTGSDVGLDQCLQKKSTVT